MALVLWGFGPQELNNKLLGLQSPPRPQPPGSIRRDTGVRDRMGIGRERARVRGRGWGPSSLNCICLAMPGLGCSMQDIVP